jgi:hypothetical protein
MGKRPDLGCFGIAKELIKAWRWPGFYMPSRCGGGCGGGD